MSSICHVHEKPDPSTLARVEYHDTETEPALKSDLWKRRTPEDQREWEQAQIAAGWVPVFPVESVDQQAIYAAQLALGYLDAPTGIKLKTTEYAQQKFTSQVTLLQVALGAGAITPSTPVEFWDFNDAPQSLPLSDFMGLVLRYGFHCSQLFKDYAP